MASNGEHKLPAIHTDPEEFLKHDYDFIICGGGTAGCTFPMSRDERVVADVSLQWLSLPV
jgi:hypothetical protein